MKAAGLGLDAQGVQVVRLQFSRLPGAGADHLRRQLRRGLLDRCREPCPFSTPGQLYYA